MAGSMPRGQFSFEILGRVDAGKVEERCSHAKVLLDYFTVALTVAVEQESQ